MWFLAQNPADTLNNLLTFGVFSEHIIGMHCKAPKGVSRRRRLSNAQAKESKHRRQISKRLSSQRVAPPKNPSGGFLEKWRGGKFTSMVIGSRQRLSVQCDDVEIKIDDQIIKRVDHTKSLGLTIDAHLSLV